MQTYRPTTPGRRGMTRPDYTMITKNTPEKRFLQVLSKKSGRNNQGKITARHHGGGAKRMYRIVEFGESNRDIPAKVLAIEYDPNRSARIALIEYENGEQAYILAPENLQVGSLIICAEKPDFRVGNRMKIGNILNGTFVYNIELIPGKGGVIARSAGSSAKVLASEGKYTTVSMPSGETRKILSECYATIGLASNSQHNLRVLGKAGRKRHMGRRPEVRGTAMNPKDHPHGGGEGRAPAGLKYRKTPWGKHAHGVRTRNKKKYSRNLILQRRTKNKN